MEQNFLNICEIFYSLQGEGPYIGTPSIFLRLGGCVPPYCPFCDTKYAWNEYEKYPLLQVIDIIKKFNCKNIIITGGEPFLQWRLGLESLVNILYKEGFFLQFETSGKIEIPDKIPGKIVCSPKYINGKWHFFNKNLSVCDYFKFIGCKTNLSIILNFIKHNKIPQEKIYIMPLGASKKEQLEIMPLIFDFCKTHGLKMSPRLHILCFGEKRGI